MNEAFLRSASIFPTRTIPFFIRYCLVCVCVFAWVFFVSLDFVGFFKQKNLLCNDLPLAPYCFLRKLLLNKQYYKTENLIRA